jgi:hypothetical protein
MTDASLLSLFSTLMPTTGIVETPQVVQQDVGAQAATRARFQYQ